MRINAEPNGSPICNCRKMGQQIEMRKGKHQAAKKGIKGMPKYKQTA